jgi:lipid-A-disaccharide synthase
MIVAGEASGDLHAARLASELRRRNPGLHIFGCGGAQMAAAACELLVDAREIAVVGLFEVVGHLPLIYRRYRRLVNAMRQRLPKAVVLVDFPDFNLRLACHAHAAGLQVIYFISPQLWAWRTRRVNIIRRCVDRMICIFPFERKFYLDRGIDAAYVGHPLVDSVRPQASREAFVQRLSLDPATELIALLPGSRRREVQFHLPTILEAATRIHQERGVHFVIPVASTLSKEEVRSLVPPPQTSYVHVIAGNAYEALAHSRLAIVSSGTATVETALLGTPMVVVYRLSSLTYGLGRRFVRSPHYAMVNLILEQRVVPELIQADFTAQAVVNWSVKLLDDDEERRRMCGALAQVRERLGPPGAISRAADLVEETLRTP